MEFSSFQDRMQREEQSLTALCIQPQALRHSMPIHHLGLEGGQHGWPGVTSA